MNQFSGNMADKLFGCYVADIFGRHIFCQLKFKLCQMNNLKHIFSCLKGTGEIRIRYKVYPEQNYCNFQSVPKILSAEIFVRRGKSGSSSQDRVSCMNLLSTYEGQITRKKSTFFQEIFFKNREKISKISKKNPTNPKNLEKNLYHKNLKKNLTRYKSQSLFPIYLPLEHLEVWYSPFPTLRYTVNCKNTHHSL